MKTKLKIGLVQYSPVWENKLGSIEKIKKLLTETNKIDLLIFPEMTITGFTMKSSDYAEPFKGETYSFFSSKSVQLYMDLLKKVKRRILTL
jgi:omega-amidase